MEKSLMVKYIYGYVFSKPHGVYHYFSAEDKK